MDLPDKPAGLHAEAIPEFLLGNLWKFNLLVYVHCICHGCCVESCVYAVLADIQTSSSLAQDGPVQLIYGIARSCPC